jgi:23S rRNA (uridine2552-2'-O)-methyltransferase
MAYNPKDFFFKQAKKENYAARSVFKLEEMDAKFQMLKPGQKVLDLGCAPGSWAQYASKRIGPKGRLVGIDLQKVKFSLPNAIFFEGDAFSEGLLELALSEVDGIFDIVLSDMAPKTTGVRVQDQERSLTLCRSALEVCRKYLRPGGRFVVKIFQSGDSPEFVKEMKEVFERVEIARPKSVRSQSFEIYILGMRKKSVPKE